MIAVTTTRTTGPDSIEVLELPDPTPAAGEVLVHVEAATINPADAGLVSGAMNSRLPAGVEPPLVPGWDLAGTVQAVGEGVDAALVTRQVLGFSPWFGTGNGTQAELVALPVANVAAASGTLPSTELTTFGLNGLTALHLLRAAGLTEGSTLLVLGATGGVGGFVVQFADLQGITVLATAASADRELVAGFGATHVIGREVDDLVATVRGLVPGGVDAVLNTVPGDAMAIGAVRDGGVYRSVTTVPEAERDIDVQRVGVKPDAQGLAEIVALAEAGSLAVRVEKTYPAVEAGAAYADFVVGHHRGRIVLTF